MGTPAFPDLGKHCFVDDCKQLDFLPFTCDRCRQVFCLQHRSYIKHNCPTADKNDVTVVVCPLCAKGVRLIGNEDPNISWETHVNTECDPSNYDRVTKKPKCPVKGCRETLTFSNTIKCRECTKDHCLKHRFSLDHSCPGPKKPDPGFQFMNLLNRGNPQDPKAKTKRPSTTTSSSSWSNFFSAAEAGVSSKFASVTSLVEHVQKVHEKKQQSRVLKLPVDVCPKCSKGFRDPVDLVAHVERDHGGTSKA
ncbi:Zinc finger AN1 and C2H2 domain-containing stress-associated protein 11 [Linum grandiflorum]